MTTIGDGRTVHLRTYQVGQLRAAIEELEHLEDPHHYVANFLGRGTVDLLEQNPCGRQDDLALILTLDRSTVVGRLGLIAGRVRFNGTENRLHWLSGFFLAREYRETGAGGMMLLAALSFSKHLLASGGPAPETQELYRAAGFTELRRLARFVGFLSARVPVAWLVGEGHLSSLAGALASPFVRGGYGLARAALRAYGRGPRPVFETVGQLPHALDPVLAAAPGNRFPKTVRDLNWVLAHRPALIAHVARRDGRLVGYSLIRIADQKPGGSHRLPSMRLGSLWDHYICDAGPADQLALIEHLHQVAIRRGAEVVEVQAHDPNLEAVLRRACFVRLGGNRVFYRSPDRARTGSPWHITHGVADAIFT